MTNNENMSIIYLSQREHILAKLAQHQPITLKIQVGSLCLYKAFVDAKSVSGNSTKKKKEKCTSQVLRLKNAFYIFSLFVNSNLQWTLKYILHNLYKLVRMRTSKNRYSHFATKYKGLKSWHTKPQQLFRQLTSLFSCLLSFKIFFFPPTILPLIWPSGTPTKPQS